MVILAIDPGSAGAGNALARFDGEQLTGAGFARAPYLYTGGAGAIVVEKPAYQGERSRAARPQDLINLSWSGALLAGYLMGTTGAQLVELTPQAWKGSEAKPMMHARALEVLTPAELTVLGGELTRRTVLAAREKGALDRWSKPGVSYYPAAFKTHNLLDAACLGLVHLGRLTKR